MYAVAVLASEQVIFKETRKDFRQSLCVHIHKSNGANARSVYNVTATREIKETRRRRGVTALTVAFTDFASAGNTWDRTSAYRVWLPTVLPLPERGGATEKGNSHQL